MAIAIDYEEVCFAAIDGRQRARKSAPKALDGIGVYGLRFSPFDQGTFVGVRGEHGQALLCQAQGRLRIGMIEGIIGIGLLRTCRV
jgi:hypothetical protein